MLLFWDYYKSNEAEQVAPKEPVKRSRPKRKPIAEPKPEEIIEEEVEEAAEEVEEVEELEESEEEE